MNRRKLTDDQARDIKRRLANGESFRAIAAIYEVSQSTVALIANGKTYQEITIEESQNE